MLAAKHTTVIVTDKDLFNSSALEIVAALRKAEAEAAKNAIVPIFNASSKLSVPEATMTLLNDPLPLASQAGPSFEEAFVPVVESYSGHIHSLSLTTSTGEQISGQVAQPQTMTFFGDLPELVDFQQSSGTVAEQMAQSVLADSSFSVLKF